MEKGEKDEGDENQCLHYYEDVVDDDVLILANRYKLYVYLLARKRWDEIWRNQCREEAYI